MRRALTFAVTVVALAAFASGAPAQDRPRVRDVRVGAHAGFDRVVIELDGAAEIAWERGPEPLEESFYIDADLGRRERTVRTKLEKVGTVSLKAMRVGTHVSLEPRARRVRAYVLNRPTRLVIDLAPPGPEEFAAPAGVTPLSPATSIGSLKNAVIPQPEPKAEPEPAPEPEPEHEEPAPQPKQAETPVTPPNPPSGEPQEGAVEGEHGSPPPEAEVAAPAAEVTPEPPGPEPAPEPAPAAEVTPPVEVTPPMEVTPPPPQQAEAPPEVAPAPAPAPQAPEDGGFPWLTALGALVAAAGVGALGYLALRREAAPILVRSPGAARAPVGADDISREELRLAADTSEVIEKRLDEEVRARMALEERLGEASEELKVLRDRLNRVERKREEAL